MSEIELKARDLLASCLNEWGHHQEAGNVRDGDDLESYEFELRVIGQLLRFGFDTGHGHATRAPQWQPIETAPKDGTEILAWDGQGQATVSWKNGRWSLVYAGWRAEDGDFDAAINWQPLPAPPEVEE